MGELTIGRAFSPTEEVLEIPAATREKNAPVAEGRCSKREMVEGVGDCVGEGDWRSGEVGMARSRACGAGRGGSSRITRCQIYRSHSQYIAQEEERRLTS